MIFDTVIFDLDGTLLDTLDDLADSVNFTLAQAGFPERSRDEVRKSVGNGIKNLIRRVAPEGTPEPELDACDRVFRAHYSKNMQNKTKPYDGIPELLAILKERGVKMAVVSNKYDQAVKGLCGAMFSGYISVAIGESSAVHRKPAPDSLFEAMRELCSSKENTLYVGDSEIDVRTSKNAGIRCVGVTWGFRDRDVLEAEGADGIVDSPAELLRLMKAD